MMKKLIKKLIFSLLFLPLSAQATVFTVKAGGGGNFTTIQACVNGMASGDTCTVFAGTYNENVTVTAGAVNLYNTVNVNGSDVVTVLSFTLNSHTKLIGNCPSAPSTFGTCGFSIQPSSVSTACISVGSSTDVFVRNNTGQQCGTLSMTSSASFIYIQGNTLTEMCRTPSSGTACDGIAKHGNHVLIEGNDISHYRLGINYQGTFGLFRNNLLHDQIESESGQHTDAFFSEPVTEPSQNHVIEGNTQNNAVGPNAKGNLSQGDACSGNCFNLIVRFNVSSNIDGGGFITDDNSGSATNPGFFNVKTYNNTMYNYLRGGGLPGIVDYYNSHSNNPTDVNNLFYWPGTIGGSGASPVFVSNVTTPNWGFNLGFCVASPSSNCNLLGHLESGNFNGDATGNIYGCMGCSPVNDPRLVNPSGGDFHLQAGSVALNAGTNLTTANGSGSNSTTLVVNDASPFQDGMGLQNPYSTVQGDCISVTTVGNHVCVTAVNYSTNTLTLASPTTWATGDKVWLYSDSSGTVRLIGSAPNIGAFGTAGTLAPPTNLQAVPVVRPFLF